MSAGLRCICINPHSKQNITPVRLSQGLDSLTRAAQKYGLFSSTVLFIFLRVDVISTRLY
ncbi:MAG: hypothetical protein DA446_03860 [Bacteroidetes bacterium]|nr:hypothetical protein [Bacteroidota bacterium]PTM15702.1 MAG: hypothetical protein DA443_02700 [Bacteroidota bacterium]PTM20289.1 MAG: hypothetical protein DA446_03860 [Bacteroidota bacterium]